MLKISIPKDVVQHKMKADSIINNDIIKYVLGNNDTKDS